MHQLYSAPVCPFAQRVRALLVHLEVPFELTEVDLSRRDPAFLALTPTGKVPLLVRGDLRLFESSVILEWIAETEGAPLGYRAWAADADLRARQRLAAKRFEEAIAPAFYRSLGAGGALDLDGESAGRGIDAREALERELDLLAATAQETSPTALLAFHAAPFWARMDWLRAHSELPARVDARPDLRSWLDEAVALPAVRETLPEQAETVRLYEERFVGAGG